MRSKFDQQLAALNQELTEMGATCAQAIGLAAQALEQQDVALAAPVGQLEEQTNEQERTIEALCLKLLLQQQPVARDLRQISAALKMITDMERIGDQAADIAEISPFFLSHDTFDGTLVCRMAQQASSMVTQSVDAFVRRDVYLARSVAGQDDLVDEDFTAVKQALIAAIDLDGGLEKAAQFVLPFVEEDLGHEEAPFVDYKTRLQEIIQKNPEERVEYVLVSAQGPDHDKKFVVEVHLNSNVIGRGVSRSKKGAEQAAAQEALSLMGEI